MVLALVWGAAPPLSAASPPRPEPATGLYVLYEPHDPPIISIEISNQQRLPLNGGVSATLAVRAESLIAYDLELQASEGASAAWGESDFMPLYPGRVYELGAVRIRPGGEVRVRASKLGATDDRLWKRAAVQLAVLSTYLLGAKPPAGLREDWRDAAEAADMVEGLFRSGAPTLAGIVALYSQGDAAQMGSALVAALGAIDNWPGKVAAAANLILQRGDVLSGPAVQAGWSAVERQLNGSRLDEPLRQLREYPASVMATVTLAPVASVAAPRYRVVRAEARYHTTVEVQNIGSRAWPAGEEYELLVLANGAPLARQGLAAATPQGAVVRWELDQRAPAETGLYRLAYQMAWRGWPIGPAIPGEIIVVGGTEPGMWSDLRALAEEGRLRLGELLSRRPGDAGKRSWVGLWQEIDRRLRELCAGTFGALAMTGAAAGWGSRRRKRHDIR